MLVLKRTHLLRMAQLDQKLVEAQWNALNMRRENYSLSQQVRDLNHRVRVAEQHLPRELDRMTALNSKLRAENETLRATVLQLGGAIVEL